MRNGQRPVSKAAREAEHIREQAALQAPLEADGVGREAAQQQNKGRSHGQGQDESLLP